MTVTSQSNPAFVKIRDHLCHNTEVVVYGDDVNAAVVCVDCDTVIVDADNAVPAPVTAPERPLAELLAELSEIFDTDEGLEEYDVNSVADLLAEARRHLVHRNLDAVVLVDPAAFRNHYDDPEFMEPDEAATVAAATDDQIQAALESAFAGDFLWHTLDECFSDAMRRLIAELSPRP